MSALRFLRDPSAEICGDNAGQFLRNLGGPTCVFLSGTDARRCRAFVTLLHGNEPSGLYALRRWLLSGQRPAVNVLVIVASVPAALAQPLFSQRMLAGARDLNRCFRPPHADREGRLAHDILALFDAHQPEAVLDMHNTSGSGPAFGVVNHVDLRHNGILGLFTDRAVVSALNLGALMELSDGERPIVTVEVGGRLDEAAHELAWQGLQRYLRDRHVVDDTAAAGREIDMLYHPIRLELGEGVTLGYGHAPQAGCQITLLPDVEQYNFGSINERTCLGWASGRLRELFRAIDAQGQCAVSRLLQLREGQLFPAQALKLFMITSNATIARTDCLCYVVADDGGPLRSVA